MSTNTSLAMVDCLTTIYIQQADPKIKQDCECDDQVQSNSPNKQVNGINVICETLLPGKIMQQADQDCPLDNNPINLNLVVITSNEASDREKKIQLMKTWFADQGMYPSEEELNGLYEELPPDPNSIMPRLIDMYFWFQQHPRVLLSPVLLFQLYLLITTYYSILYKQ